MENTKTTQNAPHTTERARPAMILWQVIKQTCAYTFVLGYILFLLACCAVFCLVEPETFPSFGNAIWCVFQMITTIGFGDIVPTSAVLRVLSVLIGISSLFVVALITGVVVSFFNETIRVSRNESFVAFGQQLEHLSELSPEELATMEASYREFKRGRGNSKMTADKK